jgi:hypothetical protein
MIHDKKICKNLKEAMRETIHSQRVQKWWVEKQHFTKQQIYLMGHNASKSAMGQVWVARKRWVCKFAANYEALEILACGSLSTMLKQ